MDQVSGIFYDCFIILGSTSQKDLKLLLIGKLSIGDISMEYETMRTMLGPDMDYIRANFGAYILSIFNFH